MWKSVYLREEWKFFRLTYIVNEGQTHNFIALRVGDETGSVWFDGVELREGGVLGLMEGESLSEGNIWRLQEDETAGFTIERYRDMMRFYRDTEVNFFVDEMAGCVRDAGCMVPISNTQSVGLPDIEVSSRLDYMDCHNYWSGVQPVEGGWSVSNKVELASLYELSNNISKNTIHYAVSRTAAGKALTISEHNVHHPNDHEYQHGPLMSAYGCFHSWDGIYWFNFQGENDYGGWPRTDTILGYHDVGNNSLTMTLMPSGALTFIRGDVAPANLTIELTYTPEEVLDGMKEYTWASGDLCVQGDLDERYGELHAIVKVNFEGDTIKTADDYMTEYDLIPIPENGDMAFASDTGELMWDVSIVPGSEPECRNDLFTINAARTQAVVGRLIDPDGYPRSISLDNMTLQNSAFSEGAVVLSSLTDEPLDTAERVLITAVRDVRNAGRTWNQDCSVLTDWGWSGPQELGMMTCSIVYRVPLPAGAIEVWPLDERGRRMENPIHVITFQGPDYKNYRFTISENYAAAWYEINGAEIDLAVHDAVGPEYGNVGVECIFNVYAVNLGMNDVNDVCVELKVDGIVEAAQTVTSIQAGSSVAVSMSWTPAADDAGGHSVTISIAPAPNENILHNNHTEWTMHVADDIRKTVVVDPADTDPVRDFLELLESVWRMHGTARLEVDLESLDHEDFTYEELAETEADVVLISGYSSRALSGAELNAVEQYVAEGHGLVVTYNAFARGEENAGLASFMGINAEKPFKYVFEYPVMIPEIPGHPLFNGFTADYEPENDACFLPWNGAWRDEELFGARYAARASDGSAAVIACRGMAYFSICPEKESGFYDRQILYNALTWSRYSLEEHDLEITALEIPLSATPYEPATICMEIWNAGRHAEYDVHVELLINDVATDMILLDSLESNEKIDVNMMWEGGACGGYEISGFIPPVPGEEIVNNNRKDGVLGVTAETPVKAAIMDSFGTDHPEGAFWRQVCSEWSVHGPIPVILDDTSLAHDSVTLEDIQSTNADVIIISAALEPWWSFTTEEIQALGDYLDEGHGLLVTGVSLTSRFSEGERTNSELAALLGFNPFLKFKYAFTGDLNLEQPEHPLFNNIDNPYQPGSNGTGAMPSDLSWDENDLTTAQYLALSADKKGAITLDGRRVYLGTDSEKKAYENNFQHRQLIYNAITYAGKETVYELPSIDAAGKTATLLLMSLFLIARKKNETSRTCRLVKSHISHLLTFANKKL